MNNDNQIMKPILQATESEAKKVWQGCLSIIKEDVNHQSFKTWFEPIRPVSITEKELMVTVPSKFFYEWIESHFHGVLKKSLHQMLGPMAILKYQIATEEVPVIADMDDEVTLNGMDVERPQYVNGLNGAPPETPQPAKPAHAINLNTKYNFDNFIKGDSNQLARAAAFAVSENPGSTSFNPLLIYGGVGLGKTHLIQAIGNRVKKTGKITSILYASSEKFTVEFVNAIQHNKVAEFTAFYRNVDLLIVDDIQFFAGKEKTQEEFFHIFNTLHQAGKQIVLSSDRPPKDLKGLEERLLSRFQWGLTTDIQPPDLETRIAILRHKAQHEKIKMPDEVVEFIATNVTDNVRQLEGCLIKLAAQSSFTKAPIDLAMARDTLRDMIKPTKVDISIDSIQKIVCEYFSIGEDMLRAKTRKQEIVKARQIAMFLSKEFTRSSLKTIGLHFGGRDHTTVIHACDSVKNQSDIDEKYRKLVSDIRRKIEMNIL